MPQPTEIQLVECPRDAMQGLADFVPTDTKIQYLNALLGAGFHTLDFGSFVSPKAVPQLADTADVLRGLDLCATETRLLAIVANARGAEDAAQYEEIAYLGYPFSISETFQLRNTKKTVAESLDLVKAMQELCEKRGKTLVVYLSMGFGNPYGDPWSPELLLERADEMRRIGVRVLSLADTVGGADPADVRAAFAALIPEAPEVVFGAHFHAAPDAWRPKVAAAWDAGCRRFDGALRGFGGCPFAEDQLVGNIATENLVAFFKEKAPAFALNEAAYKESLRLSPTVFG